MVISVLFARADSNYKAIPGCDVWDADRDALNWPGGGPVIAHPPCRAWGRLRAFANPAVGEMDLARWAVAQVRQWGGVLEHPAGSTLWTDQQLPYPGQCDDFGGWTLPIWQNWFGHRATKRTWLYIVGCAPRDIPLMPMVLGEGTHVVGSSKRDNPKPKVTKAEREHTPPELATWMVDLATRCTPVGRQASRNCGMKLNCEWIRGEDMTNNDCGNCYNCLQGKTELIANMWLVPATSTRMIVCVECGNKRCPKASDCQLECSNLNSPGQPGSVYRDPGQSGSVNQTLTGE